MFQNRLNEFVSEAFFSVEPQPTANGSKQEPAMWAMPALVRTADIYQVAHNQAVQDHELDKLFNPEFYDSEF